MDSQHNIYLYHIQTQAEKMRWRYSRETENEIKATRVGGVRVYVAFCDFRGIDRSTNASL